MTGGAPSILDGPIKVVMWVACLFTVLMMAHITLDVFMRVVFSSPFIGTFEIAANYYMVSVMYLPLAYVSRHEGQIIVELFTRNLSERRLAFFDVAANAVTIVYVAVFTFYTGLTAVEQTRTGEVKEVGDNFMDIWPARWALPVAFGMLTLYLIVRMRHDYRRGRSIEPPVSA